LVVLDLEAGSEQSFDSLVSKNSQAMCSIGKSMD